MGFNIGDVSPNSAGGPDLWTFEGDLSDPSVTIVEGDFDVVSLFGGGSLGEAADGYTFSPLSTTAWGTLSFNTTTGQFTFLIDRAAVIASGSDQIVSFTVAGSDGGDSDTDTVNINILICLLHGTLVRTPDGDVPVEALRVGSRVMTEDGRKVQVRWIGSRHLDKEELSQKPDLRPVWIRKGTFGAGRPARDMWVSPQHRIALGGWLAELLFGTNRVLVPARGLIDGVSVKVDGTKHDVEYFHVLCDQHEILITEGLPTESFYPGPYSMSELDEAVRKEIVSLFPELDCELGPVEVAAPAVRMWEAQLMANGCRP